MVLALLIIISITGVLHTYLAGIYLMSLPPESTGLSSEDYLSRLTVVWRADGVAILLSVFGIWTIKMNFMLFFYRLGHQIRAYANFWWVAVVIIVACGAVLFGIFPYDCIFNDSAWVNTHCATMSKMGYITSVYKANVAVDVLSDLISKLVSLSKQFLEGSLGVTTDRLTITNYKQTCSHCVPYFHSMELEDLFVSEACSVEHILAGRVYYSRDNCPW